MRLTLKKGEKVEITLDDTDGVFTFTYGTDGPSGEHTYFVRVECDIPDDKGREGVLYEETGPSFRIFPFSIFPFNWRGE
jgi:hypothetical protein